MSRTVESHRRRWPFGRRRDEQRDLTRESLPSVMLPDAASPDAPGVRQSTGLADVWACVRVLVDGAMMAPLQVFSRTSQGARQRVTEGVTVGLLDRPAPGVSQPAYVAQLVAHLALWGECFCGKVKGPDGSVSQLLALAPDRMEVRIESGQPVFTYHQPNKSPVENLTLDDICHIRGMTLDGVRGASPIKVAREALALNKSLTESAAALHSNSGVPGGILTVPAGAGGDDQAEALAEGWEARHSGAKKRGRVAVVTGEIQWQSVTMSLADAEWVETRKLSTAEVARVMRVPAWMIGAPSGDSLTYSTVQAEADHFCRFSLGPWLRLIEQGLAGDADLFPNPSLFPKFNLDGLLRADAPTRFDLYEKAIRSGVMTANECRELEDLPPREEPV